MKSIRITSISDSLLPDLLPPALRKLRLLLIHVNAHGFINMFLTMHKGVPFYRGVECDLMPIFEFFASMIGNLC